MQAAPKPGKKRRGRRVRRDPSVAEAVRRRDGGCVPGLLLKDGCIPGFEPHHIRSYGSDPRNDILENMICVCRKHHNMAENYVIAPIVFQGMLYHFYGYGPTEDIVEVLDEIKEASSMHGFTARFELDLKGVSITYISTMQRKHQRYSWINLLNINLFPRGEFIKSIVNFLTITLGDRHGN